MAVLGRQNQLRMSQRGTTSSVFITQCLVFIAASFLVTSAREQDQRIQNLDALLRVGGVGSLYRGENDPSLPSSFGGEGLCFAEVFVDDATKDISIERTQGTCPQSELIEDLVIQRVLEFPHGHSMLVFDQTLGVHTGLILEMAGSISQRLVGQMSGAIALPGGNVYPGGGQQIQNPGEAIPGIPS